MSRMSRAVSDALETLAAQHPVVLQEYIGNNPACPTCHGNKYVAKYFYNGPFNTKEFVVAEVCSTCQAAGSEA